MLKMGAGGLLATPLKYALPLSALCDRDNSVSPSSVIANISDVNENAGSSSSRIYLQRMAGPLAVPSFGFAAE